MSRRLNEFTGVACFAGALLWLVALVSYSPTDPAWFFNSVSSGAPQNFAGRVGAFMAEAGFQLIGYAAFVCPGRCSATSAWHYFWCRDVDAPYTKVIGGSLLVGSVASLLALAFSAFETSARHFRAGGVIGEAIAAGFAVYLNRTGAAILLLTVLALAVVLSTQFSFGQAFNYVAKRVRGQHGLVERFQIWREGRRRDRERQQVIDKHVKKTGRENAPADCRQSRRRRREAEGRAREGRARPRRRGRRRRRRRCARRASRPRSNAQARPRRRSPCRSPTRSRRRRPSVAKAATSCRR